MSPTNDLQAKEENQDDKFYISFNHNFFINTQSNGTYVHKRQT